MSIVEKICITFYLFFAVAASIVILWAAISYDIIWLIAFAPIIIVFLLFVVPLIYDEIYEKIKYPDVPRRW